MQPFGTPPRRASRLLGPGDMPQAGGTRRASDEAPAAQSPADGELPNSNVRVLAELGAVPVLGHDCSVPPCPSVSFLLQNLSHPPIVFAGHFTHVSCVDPAQNLA